MDINEIDTRINSDVLKDAFGNPLREGDSIYFVSRSSENIKVGVISKFCPEFIKIFDGIYEYSIRKENNGDIVKLNNIIDNKRIEEIKSRLNKRNSIKSNPIITRYALFIYRNNFTGKRGIGWWMMNGIQKDIKGIMTENIKKANSDGYDIYFAHKTNDRKISFDKTPNALPKKDAYFTKSKGYKLTDIPCMKFGIKYDINEIRYNDLIEDVKTIEDVKIARENGKKSAPDDLSFIFRYNTNKNDSYYSFRENLIFKMIDPKIGVIRKSTYDFGVGDIVIDGSHYILSPRTANKNLKHIFNNFHTNILCWIDIKIDMESFKEIDEFFNNIETAIHSI